MRRRESRVVDEQKEAKRRKVITEFYETEKSYLAGLELIYSVRGSFLSVNILRLTNCYSTS